MRVECTASKSQERWEGECMAEEEMNEEKKRKMVNRIKKREI